MNTITIEPPVFRAAVERKHGLTKPQVTEARELAAQGRDYETACHMVAAKFNVTTGVLASGHQSGGVYTRADLVRERPPLKFLIPNDSCVYFKLELTVDQQHTIIESVPLPDVEATAAISGRPLLTEAFDTDLGPDSYR